MFVLDDGSLVHSASDLVAAAVCEFSVVRTLNRRLGCISGSGAPDPLLQRVAVVGDAHEQRLLAGYVERFGWWAGQSAGVRTLDRPGPGDYDSVSALAAMDSASRDAVAAGADVLHQAGFFDGRLVG